jgi:dUTP pyrophosphatase
VNQDLTVRFKYLPHGVGLALPAYQSALAAGADLRAAVGENEPVELLPGRRAIVPCGFAMAVRPRSGLAAKNGITVLNSPGTIDADYRGEVMVILINHSDTAFTITRGERIAQMIIAPVVQPNFTMVDDLDETVRGTSGFGSTGRG